MASHHIRDDDVSSKQEDMVGLAKAHPNYMLLWTLKALLSLFIDMSNMIIGFMLCTKLHANSEVALVSFWA